MMKITDELQNGIPISPTFGVKGIYDLLNSKFDDQVLIC